MDKVIKILLLFTLSVFLVSCWQKQQNNNTNNTNLQNNIQNINQNGEKQSNNQQNNLQWQQTNQTTDNNIISEENTYKNIDAWWKKIKIPAAWKDTWDFVTQWDKIEACNYFKSIWEAYVNLCKNKVKKNLSIIKQDKIYLAKWVCDKIVKEEYKIECYKKLSTNQKDCNFIKDDKIKNICLLENWIPKSQDIENLLWTWNSVIEQAIQKLDITMCEKIKNEDEKKICKETIYIQLAVKKDDISICDNISDKINKNQCKNNYFMEKAINSKNIKFCDNISDTQWQQDCKNAIKQ